MSRNDVDRNTMWELSQPPAVPARRGKLWSVAIAMSVVAGAVLWYSMARPSVSNSPAGASPTSTVMPTASSESSLQPAPPNVYDRATVAALPDRRQLLLVGGTSGRRSGAGLAEGSWVQSIDDRVWSLVDGPTPPPRVGHATTGVDSLGGAVVFGGGGTPQLESCLVTCPPGLLDDMWFFEGATSEWRELSLENRPTARSGHALTYVADADVVVLFGGLALSGPAERVATLLADTWVFEPGTMSWREVETADAPAPRAFHQMAFDRASGTVLLWGGRLEDVEGDPAVWRFHPATELWTEVETVPGPAPTARWNHVWVAEPRSGLVVLVGGEWFDGGRNRFGADVWAFDPATASWTRNGDLPAPVVGGAGAAAGDGTIALFAYGETGFHDPIADIWEWLP